MQTQKPKVTWTVRFSLDDRPWLTRVKGGYLMRVERREK